MEHIIRSHFAKDSQKLRNLKIKGEPFIPEASLFLILKMRKLLLKRR